MWEIVKMAIICLNTSLIYFQYVRFICTYPRDSQAEIIRLLSGESRDLFLNYFKANLTEMFS